MLVTKTSLASSLKWNLRTFSGFHPPTPSRRPLSYCASSLTVGKICAPFNADTGRRKLSNVIATAAASASLGAGGDPAEPSDALQVSEVAQENLRKAANACRRYGWISFWTQLVLTTIAAVILLFSMAFTSQNSPSISLYLTLFGIIMGFLSTFWSFGYTRLSDKLKAFLESSSLTTAPKVRRSDVINMLEKGAIINVLGAAATLLALQATIGLLVAKTLTSATVNPFMATNTTAWNPVLAFDVFNVQATTNALLSHFFSLILSLWLLRVIANRPSAASVMVKPSSR